MTEISPLPRPSRRMLMLGGCVLGLVVAAGIGGYWWQTGRFLVSTEDAYVQADIVTMAPRVAGYVAAVEVADNQPVVAGQVLVRIADSDYRAKAEQAVGAVAAAEADLVAGQAQIANLDAEAAQQQSIIAGSAAALVADDAEAQRAGLAFRRQAALFRDQVNSAQDRETAEADARKTVAGVDQARANLAAARDRLPVLATQRQQAVADLAKAKAELQQARAALALAHYDLDSTVIRAPVAGIVGQRAVRAGEYAEAGSPLLAVVPDAIYVVANYKETQLAAVRAGQIASLKVDAWGGAVVRAHVESFSPASGAQFALLPPDNATGNFTKIVQRLPVRLRIDPGGLQLRPGMSVVATIDTRGTP